LNLSLLLFPRTFLLGFALPANLSELKQEQPNPVRTSAADLEDPPPVFMASLRNSRSGGLMRSSVNDPFLDADDVGEENYNLLTSADEDVILRYGSYSNMRQSGTYGTTTPPSVMIAEDERTPLVSDDHSFPLRTAPIANVRVWLHSHISLKSIKIALLLCLFAFALGCLMTQGEEAEERHLIGLSSSVPIISFPPSTPSPSSSSSCPPLFLFGVFLQTSLTMLSATC
jgi:hypothetical protein